MEGRWEEVADQASCELGFIVPVKALRIAGRLAATLELLRSIGDEHGNTT